MAVQPKQHDAATEFAVRRHRFTVADFYRMGEVGLLAPGTRIELIDGELFELAPIGSHHQGSVMGLDEVLRDLLGRRVSLSVQGPLSLQPHGAPQPDVMVLRRRDDHYRSANPTAADVFLIVEVSDTTLAYDRDVKGPLYARAGIPEYWIVNLVDGEVIVHRDPQEGRYTSVSVLAAGDALQPLAFPDISLAVADILG